MKKLNLYLFVLFIFALSVIMESGCSSRMETPVIEDDSTIVYPPKKADDISVSITLCRKADKDTDDRVGEGTIFSIMENANIRAFVDIENRFAYGGRELMFHIDWVRANGSSFFLKRIDLPQGDSTSTINSSISISPEIREPGDYTIMVYFFRELIAEKKFEILPELQVDTNDDNGISANIILYRKKSKKTGKLIGEGNSFNIKKKEKVRALIELENRFAYGEQELIFNVDWIGSDGMSFYNKEINLYPGDSNTTFNSSISIYPGKREPGNYMLRLSLFNKVLAEQKFELQSEK